MIYIYIYQTECDSIFQITICVRFVFLLSPNFFRCDDLFNAQRVDDYVNECVYEEPVITVLSIQSLSPFRFSTNGITESTVTKRDELDDEYPRSENILNDIKK